MRGKIAHAIPMPKSVAADGRLQGTVVALICEGRSVSSSGPKFGVYFHQSVLLLEMLENVVLGSPSSQTLANLVSSSGSEALPHLSEQKSVAMRAPILIRIVK